MSIRKTTKYYPEATGDENINTNDVEYFLHRSRSGQYERDKSDMLKNMGILGDREIPIFINNATGKWINPFFAFKMFGGHGLPIEIIIDLLTKEIKEDAGKYWCEWCDFWLDTFLKGDMNKIKQNFILNT